MKSLLIPGLLLTLSFSAIAQQTPSNPFDELGNNVLAEIQKVEDDINFKVEDMAICFPESAKALRKTSKLITKAAENYKKKLKQSKETLEEELREYSAVKKLVESNPDNQAYKNLLKDLLNRYNASIQKFSISHQVNIKSFIHALPVGSLTIERDFVYENEEVRYWMRSITPHFEYTQRYTDQLMDGALVTRKFHGVRKNEEKLPKIENEPILERSTPTKIYSRCKTAGCTYLVNDLVTSFYLNLASIDLSIKINKEPLNFKVDVESVPNKPKEIKSALLRVAQAAAKNRPIGVLTPSCGDNKIDISNQNDDLFRQSKEVDLLNSESQSSVQGSYQ